MKKLLKITLTLILTIIILLGFTLPANPPGWYQQILPVSDIINDIYFLNSLTGWVVTQGGASDTSRIIKTTDGGNSWVVQNDSLFNLVTIQFVNQNIGYAAGGNGRAKFLKTTNGGSIWITTTPFGSGISDVKDLIYLNNDTGWFCSDDPFGGGIYKTTNGGINWQQQLNNSFRIKNIFMLNSDTGWAISNETNGRLYRTNNSGSNWNLQYTFTANTYDVTFINNSTGWIVGGGGNGILKTTNGGNNWETVNTPSVLGPGKIFMLNDTTGWVGCGANRIIATKDGNNWFYQNSPSFNTYSVFFTDSQKGWAGTSILIHTTDGGGPFTGIQQISSDVPQDYMLYQNYPNPFNPITNIKYSVKRETSNVKLIVYDIQGKLITILVNEEQSAGTYKTDWDASNYSSDIYFYSLIIEGRVVGTKKMMLIK